MKMSQFNDMTDQQAQAFHQLYLLLVKANEATNLTRITTMEGFAERHVGDAMALLPHIPDKAKVVDVGSGAGFPILPLLIARSDIEAGAVESIQKKAAFIRQAAQALGVANRLRVLSERAEVLGQDLIYREQADIVCARAVAALPTLLELCIPLLKVSGHFLALKGETWQDELGSAENALKALKLGAPTVLKPVGQGQLLVFQKTHSTPPNYPRRPGVPNKKPL